MAVIDGLVAYYPCYDDAGNTTVEDVHGATNITASTNTSNLSTAGPIDKAFEFNGSTEYLTADFTALDKDDVWSFSMWLTFDDKTKALNQFVGWEGGSNVEMGINIRSAGDIYCRVWDGSQKIVKSSLSGYTNGEDLLYGVSYDNGTLKLFINGSEVDSISGIGTIEARSDGDFIGTSAPPALDHDGEVSEFGFFNLAKSPDDFSSLWNSGAGLAYPFSAATTRLIKIAGTFVAKPILTKVAGTFVDKPIKIKVGGTFQDA